MKAANEEDLPQHRDKRRVEAQKVGPQPEFRRRIVDGRIGIGEARKHIPIMTRPPAGMICRLSRPYAHSRIAARRFEALDERVNEQNRQIEELFYLRSSRFHIEFEPMDDAVPKVNEILKPFF